MALDVAARLPLAPLLLAQALWLRHKAIKLPEPPGPRRGEAGTGPEMRLLIAGDSSAAGVGAAHQTQALSGQLVTALARSRRVHWQLHAHTGHTTADTLDTLRALPRQRFDVAVTALGVNDVTHARSCRRWARDQAALHNLLRTRFQTRLILCSGVPPMAQFPLLPQPLAWVLGAQASRFDQVLAQLAHAQPDLRHLPFDLPFAPQFAASDGFHPSPLAYQLWAERLSAEIDHILATATLVFSTGTS